MTCETDEARTAWAALGVLTAMLSVGRPASAQAAPPSEDTGTERIALRGDLRYRAESIDAQDEALRHRHRIRARVALEAKVLPDLLATVGVGSGDENDPVSNNQTLDGAFSSKPLWLDLAYLQYTPDFVPGLQALAGKMKNPLESVGKTELVWDSDLNPEGLALRVEPAIGIVEPFVRGGLFWVEERSAQDDASILGAQAGLKLSLAGEQAYVVLGGRYIDHIRIQGAETYWDSEDSFGNSATSEADGTLRYEHDYDLAGAFLEAGGELGGVRFSAFGDFARNTAVSDHGTAWLVGAAVGRCKRALNFCARYVYRRVERDAVVGIFTDSDFGGGGTDARGHEINLGFQLADPVRVSTTGFLNERDLGAAKEYRRVQLDLSAKF